MHEASFRDIAVKENATVRDALSAMVTRGFKVAPVVGAEGWFVGTVTLGALQELVERSATQGDV